METRYSCDTKMSSVIRRGDVVLAGEQPVEGNTCRVITITSGKGGVGKTVLATNLALMLARFARRVIVFDADFGLANVEVILGVSPPVTVYDFLKGTHSLQDLLVPAPGDIRIISGGIGLFELAEMHPYQRQRILCELQRLEKEADFLIIDTGAGISHHVLSFVAAAAEVILILTPEPTSFTDAYSLVKVLSRLTQQPRLMVVANRVRSAAEGEEVFTRFAAVVQQFLRLPLQYLGPLVEDDLLAASVREQQPLVVFKPHARAVADIERLARALLNLPSEEERRRGWQYFWARLTRLLAR